MGVEHDPHWLKGHEKNSSFKAIAEPRAKKSSLLWSRIARKPKGKGIGIRCPWLQSSKAPSWPQKECDRDDQAEEGKETFDPAQAPPAFEKGGQANQDELQEVNIGSDEEPQPMFIRGNMSTEENDTYLKF